MHARHGVGSVSCLITGLLCLLVSVNSAASDPAPTTQPDTQPHTQPADEPPPRIGDTAPDFSLKTLDDQPVELLQLTAKGPVVLVVLRGWPEYQCPVCSRQVAAFMGHAEQFLDAGARIVFVYPGRAGQLKEHADEFVGEQTFPAHFLFVTDPDYTLVNAYHLRWDAPKETAYPSTFVIDTDQVVRFAQVSRTHGGRAKPEAVLDALNQISETDQP